MFLSVLLFKKYTWVQKDFCAHMQHNFTTQNDLQFMFCPVGGHETRHCYCNFNDFALSSFEYLGKTNLNKFEISTAFGGDGCP